MNAKEALDYIHGTYKFGSKLGLDNINDLLKRMGDPHKMLKFIHVAGTNGKGSTSSFISNILIEAGYKVGLYTSPYIEVFNERIRINGENINDDDLGKYTAYTKTCIDQMLADGQTHPTEFEVVTALAMAYFKDMKCDVVVLEVGLGGRLDATNVIDTPLLSVITPLALDHVAYLGDTIDKIAFEKAGIIKENGLTIAHPQEETAEKVLKDIAAQRHNTLVIPPVYSAKRLNQTLNEQEFEYKGKTFKIQMVASYQMQNACMALEAIWCLRDHQLINVSDDSIEKGLWQTKWLARLETVSKSPFVVIDGAHNVHGIKGLKDSIEALYGDYKITAVVGMLEDKDVTGMLGEIINAFEKVVVTVPDNPRAMDAETLKMRILDLSNVPVVGAFEKIEDAIGFVDSQSYNSKDLILYFGSLYMIGHVRHHYLNQYKD